MPLSILGGILCIVSIVCGIVIVIGAFRDAIWKGVVCFLCGLYLLYYAVFEFKSPSKWLIVLIWLICGNIGYALLTGGDQSLSGVHSAN